MFNPVFLLPTLLACSTALATTYSLNPNDYHNNQIIHTDVAVIGGGSSGVYTAVRLKDAGHSVVVIEQQAQLGGHAQTYTDPVNDYTIDIGVIVFAQTDIVNNYFKRFNVPLVTLGSDSGTPQYVNPSTGKLITDFTPPNGTSFAAALQAYNEQLAKYPSIQLGFNLTYPVAEELLEPFGTFVSKHNLEALFPFIYIYNQGYVPILEIPTLYMLKYLNPTQVNSFLTGYQTTQNHDIYALYAAAGNYLGNDNVHLSSHVLAMSRTAKKVYLVVKTPTGVKFIVAKKLVSAIPPTLANLANYDLSPAEKSLFAQFTANGYVSSVLNNTGLVAGTNVQSVAPNRPFDVPKMPNPYGFGVNAGTNLTQIYYASPRPQSDAVAKASILASLERFQEAQGIEERGGEFVAFSNHAPFNLMIGVDAIRGGFYERLDRLNGKRSTFWNGAAFQSQDSSVIWEYSEVIVVPRVLAALE